VARFVIRYRGMGALPTSTIPRLTKARATLLEDAGRTLLVDGDEGCLKGMFSDPSLWVIVKESMRSRPSPPRREIKRTVKVK